MARRSMGKRKAGFLGFQSSEIAFIEDEMAALAAEYGLQVDGDVAANVSKRKQAKKARRRKPMASSESARAAPPQETRQSQAAQGSSQADDRRVTLLALKVARLELQKQQKAKHNADGDGDDENQESHARVLSKLRALLPEGGALGRCVVPGCNCPSGSRELTLASHTDDSDERVPRDVLRLAQCKRCQHGALQHAVVVAYESDKKAKKKDAAGAGAATAAAAAGGLPSGGQRLLSALYALVRLVRASGAVYASREWTRSSMALLGELLAHMKRQLVSGGAQNGLKSALELQHEKQLVGELQTLAKRAQQAATGASGREELRVELACLCDQMYFHCYYACIVLYGRGCAAVPAPDAHLRQLLALVPESADQLEAFLNRELVVPEDEHGRSGRLAVVESLALPLAEAGRSASDDKRALAQAEDAYARNPLLSVYHSRLQEGVRLFYEEGVGMSGEMDAVLASLGGDAGLASLGAKHGKKKLSQKKKHYRRERKAGGAAEHEAAVAGAGAGATALAEMPSYPLLAQWRDNCRDWCCHLFAYATPTPKALEAVAACAPLVEMGAGTGYWSALLQQQGVDIVAFDKCPPSAEDHPQQQQSGKQSSKHKAVQQNAYHGQVPPFCAVGTGGPEVLKQSGMAGRSLLLCYPPPGDAMALHCARFFQGERLVHVGEWQGDTGDRRFEKELETKFSLETQLALPNWGNSAYHLTVWRRKTAVDGRVDAQDGGRQAATRSLLTSCFRCGQSLREAVEHGNHEGDGYEDAPFKRCVLCKTNVYCSATCATRDRAFHAAEHAKRLVFLADEAALDFGNDAHFAPLLDVAALDTSEQDAVAKRTSSWRALVGRPQRDGDEEEEGDEEDEDDDEEDEERSDGEEQTLRPARGAFAFNFSA